MFPTGKRNLTPGQVRKLSSRFKLPADVFISKAGADRLAPRAEADLKRRPHFEILKGLTARLNVLPFPNRLERFRARRAAGGCGERLHGRKNIRQPWRCGRHVLSKVLA
jgi:hypothetical protein